MLTPMKDDIVISSQNQTLNPRIVYLINERRDIEIEHPTLLSFESVLILILAALSIIQFSNPITRFRLKAKNSGREFKGAIVALSFVTILSFLSKILGESHSRYYQMEVMIAVIMPITLAWLFFIIWRPIKYTPRNAKQYLNEGGKIIRRGVEKDLIDLGEELFISIEYLAEIQAKQENNYKFSTIESQLFKTLSDPFFCKILVLHVPQVVEKYIQGLKQNKVFHIELFERMAFLRQVINQAFRNEDSIFYREKLKTNENEKSFLEFVFEDYWFVSSNIVNNQHSDSQKVLAISSNDSLEKIKMYCKILQQVISAYNDSFERIYEEVGEGKVRLLQVNAKSNQITSIALFFMMQRLNNCIRWTIDEDSSIRRPDTVSKIRAVIEVYSHLLQAVRSLDKAELNEKSGEGLFDFLVGFSFVEANDDSFPWLLFLNTLEGKPSQSSCKTRDILKNKIFEQLKKDLTLNIHPRILRPMLTIFKLENVNTLIDQETQANAASYPSWIRSFKIKFFTYLYEHFIKAVQQNEFLITKGLPSHITYDSTKGVFIQKSYSGEKFEFPLRKVYGGDKSRYK
jgi:hypothetical protein